MAKWVVLRNFADTFDTIFKSVATIARTYTLQDRDGILADDTDLTLKENTVNKDTDGTFGANSDTLFPSQKASKTYTDAKVAAAAVQAIKDAQSYVRNDLADADYAVLASDFDPVVKWLVMNASIARTITLPKNVTEAVPVLRGPVTIQNTGAGTITVAAESGATVGNYSTVYTIPPSSIATFIKTATNTWRLENVTPAVPTSRTIAGVDLVDDITSAELKIAMGLWTKVSTTTAFATTSTSFVDIDPSSGLSLEFPITSGIEMEYRAFITHTSSDSSGGCAFSINGPTLTSRSGKVSQTSSTTAEVSRSSTTYGGEGLAATSVVAGNVVEMVGRVKCSASGTVILRVACETVVGHTITIEAGSYVEYRIL